MASPQPLFDNLDNWHDTNISHATFPEDYQMAKDFIYSYRGSNATFSAYRRELERFLHWAWLIANKSIRDIKRADIEAYLYFCQRPDKTWIGQSQTHRFINQAGERKPNPAWRPFVVKTNKAAGQTGYQLSAKALQAVFAILGSFYQFLIQEEWISHNPVAQIRQKSKYFRKQQGKIAIRRLSELQWDYVVETAEQLAVANPAQHERTLFIMNALFGMYLRISELCASDRWQPQMGDFHCDGDGSWWFTTVGKGNKQRDIAVSDAMLTALKRYRQSLDLPPLPAPGETTPLIFKTRGPGPITSTRQIRKIVQACFDKTQERLQQDGFQEEAQQLAAATVHWLRHTGISEDVKTRPREHVRDDAGHGSSAITDKYIDVELRARHLSKKQRAIKSDM